MEEKLTWYEELTLDYLDKIIDAIALEQKEEEANGI